MDAVVAAVAVAAVAVAAAVAAVAVAAVAVGSPAAASRESAILTIKVATTRSECYSVVFLYLYTTQQIQELTKQILNRLNWI